MKYCVIWDNGVLSNQQSLFISLTLNTTHSFKVKLAWHLKIDLIKISPNQSGSLSFGEHLEQASVIPTGSPINKHEPTTLPLQALSVEKL